MTTITGERNIQVARMITLKGMLKMEVLGMKRKGRSAYAIVKDHYGLKGNKERVLEQFTQLVDEAKEEIRHGND